MRTKTGENIVKYLEIKGSVTAKEMTEHFGISRQALFKQLAKLLTSNRIYKVGTPPKVKYQVSGPAIVRESGRGYGNAVLHKTKSVHPLIPDYVKPFLWSYNVSELDLQTHKKRIITNVLNYGDRAATDWLRKTYSVDEIAQALQYPLPGEWSKRSYNFWSLIYNASGDFKPRSFQT